MRARPLHDLPPLGLSRSPGAQILVDIETGKVLHAETPPCRGIGLDPQDHDHLRDAARRKEGRITLDKLLTVSPNARAVAGHAGFPVGTTITVDNALKILLVEVCERCGGRACGRRRRLVENFAEIMNRHAQRLGMTRSLHGPNGLPADEQVTSRATWRSWPRCHQKVSGLRLLLAPARHPVRQEGAAQLQLADRPLSGRRRHEDRFHLRLRFQSGRDRHARRQAADRGRARRSVVSWTRHQGGSASRAWLRLRRARLADAATGTSAPSYAEPPNLREDMCGKHRKKQASEDEDDSAAIAVCCRHQARPIRCSCRPARACW